MDCKQRLHLTDVSTRILAKGNDEQAKIFGVYVDLGIEAVNKLIVKDANERKAKELELAKAKELAEKPVKAVKKIVKGVPQDKPKVRTKIKVKGEPKPS